MFAWLTCFHVCFEIAQVYFRLTGCRVYKGHLQNEWVIKTSRKHPKSRKIVCIKSGLHFMHNLYPFCRNSKISRDSSYRFLWNFAQQKTSTQSKHTANSRKVVGKKCARDNPRNGNMGYDQYTVPDDSSCRPYFCCVPFSTRKHMSIASRAILSISLKNS